jgi:tetratricopeptide (TPR) repeat protein
MTKVSGWLLDAAGKSQGKEQAALIQQLASVRNLQADYAGSADMYRKALEANHRDVLAMNNLAYLLSAKERQHEDALKLIAQAKGVMGEHPSLLDTEAMIRLNNDEPEKAFKLLEVVIAEAPNGSAYFHLAQVELAAKHEFEAKIAWRRALELGLHVGDLHPLERPEFERIATKFK